MSEELSMSMFATVADYKAARDAAEALDREHAQRLTLQHHAADREDGRVMSEKKTIEIAVYRDPEGNPTCAVDWGAGHVCKFLQTSKFGFVEHCFFGAKGADVIERDGNSAGWLRPIPACLLWPSSGRDSSVLSERLREMHRNTIPHLLDAAESLDREHAQRLTLQHHAADIAEELRMMTAGRDAALAEMNAWSQIDDARNQRDRARTELTLQALSERDAERADVERLLDALKEIGGRIKSHPAYEELTPDEEIKVGGDTAEFSYLARVADEAINAKLTCKP